MSAAMAHNLGRIMRSLIGAGKPRYAAVLAERLCFIYFAIEAAVNRLMSEHHGDCTPGCTVFVWMTEIETFHEEIMSKGYRYNRPGIEDTFYDAKCVQVTDPFGNRIRFNENMKAESEDEPRD